MPLTDDTASFLAGDAGFYRPNFSRKLKAISQGAGSCLHKCVWELTPRNR